MQTLKEYINEHFNGSQTAFAKSQLKNDGSKAITKQQVGQMLEKDFIVIEDRLYLFRRELNKA